MKKTLANCSIAYLALFLLSFDAHAQDPPPRPEVTKRDMENADLVVIFRTNAEGFLEVEKIIRGVMPQHLAEVIKTLKGRMGGRHLYVQETSDPFDPDFELHVGKLMRIYFFEKVFFKGEKVRLTTLIERKRKQAAPSDGDKPEN